MAMEDGDDVAVAFDDDDEDTAEELTGESMQRLIDIGKLNWHEDEHEQYMLVHVYVGKWETVRTPEYCSFGLTLHSMRHRRPTHHSGWSESW